MQYVKHLLLTKMCTDWSLTNMSWIHVKCGIFGIFLYVSKYTWQRRSQLKLLMSFLLRFLLKKITIHMSWIYSGITIILLTLLIHLQILKRKECSVRLNYPHLDVMVFLRGCFVNVHMNWVILWHTLLTVRLSVARFLPIGWMPW